MIAIAGTRSLPQLSRLPMELAPIPVVVAPAISVVVKTFSPFTTPRSRHLRAVR